MSENYPTGLFHLERLPFATDQASWPFRCRIRSSPALDYSGESQPAAGGDFFDFIPLEPNGLMAVIGHVSGPSSTAETLLIPALRGFLPTRLPGDAGNIRGAVHDLNRALSEASPHSIYATLFSAAIDPERRELHYVNAGHEPALLVRGAGDRVYRLESTGTLLGLTSRSAHGRRTIALEPGDLLAAFTDGVVEAADSAGQLFGESGVLRVLREHAGAPASQLARRLVDAVSRFEDRTRPADDHTVIVVRVKGTLANAALEDDAVEAAFAAA